MAGQQHTTCVSEANVATEGCVCVCVLGVGKWGCSPSELTGIVLEETRARGPDVLGQEKVRRGQSEEQKVWSDGEGRG